MHDGRYLRTTLSRMLLALTCAAGTVAAATLETNAQTPSRQTDSQLLEDFNHYVTIANIEMAKASAQALIDRGLPPATFVGIVEDSATIQERFERAYRRAILMPDLESVAARLYGLYEEGRLARARDPKEIDRNIALLTGMARGRLLAQQRLAFAGEYAVPQMLLVLQGRKDQLLSTEVSAQLAMMGRQSVQPLCAALLGVDPATQEMIARVLGRIAYPSALPYLAELHQTTTNPQVKAAAAKAIGQLGGSLGDSSVAGMYRDLAEQYYAEPKSLTSFPSEKYQLVWSYAPSTGLQPTAVRTEVFHEAMAMGLCERALRLDPTDQAAISLWLASNFSRETDQPAEYENPMYPASRRDAMYYAVAAGAEATQRVLARALADRDTPLARQAIEALSRSAGVSGLVGMDGSVPLVDALTYPERRVRFEAALALGRAKPREPFAGADRVVPTLAGVIREGAKRYAVVLASDLERQQALRKLLEGQGFVVLPPGSSLEAVSPSIADASGIDLVLADVTSAGTIELIEQARNNSRLQATPILGLMSASGYTQYAGQFEGDRLTQILRQGVSDAQLTEGIRQLVERAAGPVIDDEESKLYAAAALDVLHDVAIVSGGASAGASAFDINDAAVPLINALSEVKGDLRVQVADVLSYIGQERAQVALMDAVINSTGGERLVLMTKMNNSAKRFGNLLEARQVKWLVDLAEKGASEDATVAASLIGALNLPNERLVPLIVGPAR